MSDLAPKCSEVREDISKGSNCNQASSNMLTQQVRIIRLQACQMHYYASCSVLSGPVLSLLLMIVQLCSHPLTRFTHYLMFSRFLSSSTFYPPPEAAAGTLPDLTSACPQCQGGLTCSFAKGTIYPAPHSQLCNRPLRPCCPPPFTIWTQYALCISGTSKRAGVGTITWLLGVCGT